MTSEGGTDMEKAIITVLFAAIVSLLGWTVKSTHDLTISVAQMEYILQQIALEN
jgi:metal-dependent HD superfamily phosphatase/phosphodiesterase